MDTQGPHYGFNRVVRLYTSKDGSVGITVMGEGGYFSISTGDHVFGPHVTMHDDRGHLKGQVELKAGGRFEGFVLQDFERPRNTRVSFSTRQEPKPEQHPKPKKKRRKKV